MKHKRLHWYRQNMRGTVWNWRLVEVCASINSKGKLRINAKYWSWFFSFSNPLFPSVSLLKHVSHERMGTWEFAVLSPGMIWAGVHMKLRSCQGIFTFAKWYCLVYWCQKAQLNKTSLLKSNPPLQASNLIFSFSRAGYDLVSFGVFMYLCVQGWALMSFIHFV